MMFKNTDMSLTKEARSLRAEEGFVHVLPAFP